MRLKDVMMKVLWVAFVSCGVTQSAVAQQKPNIVYILADDLGLGDVRSFTNVADAGVNSPVDTPNIDSIASRGMKFTNAHAPSAVCSPTRYGIMTGRYAWRTSLQQSVLLGYDSSLIAPERTTVAEMAKQNGYSTAMFGKWHLGLDWSTSDGRPVAFNGSNIDYAQPINGGPVDQGFDTFFGVDMFSAQPYTFIQDRHTVGIPTGSFPGIFGRKGPVSPGYEQVNVMPAVASAAANYVAAQAQTSDPFFMYMPIPAPHAPILPPEFITNDPANAGNTKYENFVLTADWAVGEVLGALDDPDGDGDTSDSIRNDTMIVFASDNGVAKKYSSSGKIAAGFVDEKPLRGQKRDIYEGGHRIPMLVEWGDNTKVVAGSMSDEYVELNDLFATVADILGEGTGEGVAEDSYSMLTVFEGGESLRDAGVHHAVSGVFAIRWFDELGVEWKLVFGDGSGGTTWPWGAKANPLYAITASNLDDYQLFNMTMDVGETTNLLADGATAEELALVQGMQGTLAGYINDGRSAPILASVPESGTLMVLITGVVCLVMGRRKRKHRPCYQVKRPQRLGTADPGRC